jgi:hypothetical protein
VTDDISKDLKVAVGEDKRLQGSRKRNAVPPPTTDEVQESGTRRGMLVKVKP